MFQPARPAGRRISTRMVRNSTGVGRPDRFPSLMQALATIKKIIQAANCQILARLL